MINNTQKLNEFENNYIKYKKNTIEENFRIANAMYDEAVELGIIPLSDPLDGIDIIIKIAKVINYVPNHSKKNLSSSKKT